jgi:hypothetical protein
VGFNGSAFSSPASTVYGNNSLRTWRNMVLRKIFGLQGKKEQETGENSILNSLKNCTSHQI